MIKNSLFLFVFFSFSLLNAQDISPWKRINSNKVVFSSRSTIQNKPSNEILFELDEVVLKESLLSFQKADNKKEIIVEFPNKNGILEQFTIKEFSNFEPDLQSQFPEIRAYVGKGVTDKNATIHFSLSPRGIQTMTLRPDTETEFIERYSDTQSVYLVSESQIHNNENLKFNCSTKDLAQNKQLLAKSGIASSSNGVFRTLRIALACTSEYTSYFGGISGALAGMNATLTRVNGIFNRDLAVHLNLVSNNLALIYNNAATDPFSPVSLGIENDIWNLELQKDLADKIGNANYDIGHLFGVADGATGGGGNAGCIGCVCVNPTSNSPMAKGSAYTCAAEGKPEGDSFDIDFVAHEMGHQLGANHIFSHEIEGTGVNVEPGGGSTIMSYAGVTDYNLQFNSDDYFGYVSINQIKNNLATKSCPTTVLLTTPAPIANAGADYTIPKSTAFALKGTASNPNGATLSYCWEQNDSVIFSFGANSIAYPTKTDGPLFRSFKPTVSPIRYMPAFSKVLNNTLNSIWESVSDVSRFLNFSFTVRDNAAKGLAQTNTDEMMVIIDASKGPFEVTSQNSTDTSWSALSWQTITWAVNNTANLPGSSSVNIKLSVDGGLTFSTVLKSNTPNDGSETIIVPKGITGKNCRILIEPTDNIYFAINKEPFAIGYTTVSKCVVYNFPGSFAIPDSNSYTSKTINVPATTAIVSDVNVAVDFEHTFLSDVQLEIVNPQGNTVKLFEKGCSDTNSKLLLNFDDVGGSISCGKSSLQTVAPFEPLILFNETNPAGIWVLRARDRITGDVGTVNSASVTICTKEYTPTNAVEVDLKEVLVYPNPTKGEFSVLFSSKFTSGVTILVHDLLGRKVYENNFSSTPLFNETIQLSGLQAGIYLLKIIDSDNITIKKITKN